MKVERAMRKGKKVAPSSRMMIRDVSHLALERTCG